MRAMLLSTLLAAAMSSPTADLVNVTSGDGSVTVTVSAKGIIGIISGAHQSAQLLDPSGKTRLDPGDRKEFSPSQCVQIAGRAAPLSVAGEAAVIKQDW